MPVTTHDVAQGLQFDPDFSNQDYFTDFEFVDDPQHSPDSGKSFVFLKRFSLLQALGVNQRILNKV